MGGGAGRGANSNNSNPTAVRTAGGGRLAGVRTVGAEARLRNRGGSLTDRFNRARRNVQNRARRVANR